MLMAELPQANESNGIFFESLQTSREDADCQAIAAAELGDAFTKLANELQDERARTGKVQQELELAEMSCLPCDMRQNRYL